MKVQVDAFQREKQSMTEQIKKYAGFVERMYKDTAQLKSRLTAAKEENLLLKEQLAKLQAEYAKTQQLALALSMAPEMGLVPAMTKK